MNFLNLAQTAVVAAMSAAVGVGIGLKSHSEQDVVKAKYIEVTDKQGRTRVIVDSRGVSLYGYEAGQRGLDGTMLRISEGNQLRVSVGLHDDAQAGMTIYNSKGAVKGYQLATLDKAVLALIGGEDPRMPKESFGGGFDGCSALRLDSTPEKTQIKISDPKKETKTIEIGGG